MSISKDKSSVMYVGNGIAAEFPFDFKVWEPTHIIVTQADGEGTETNVTSQVSVSVTETGGTVLLPSPLPVGYKLHIRRAMPFIQEDRYITGTRFDPHEIEDALDIACAERQELREQSGRAVKVPVTSDKTPEQYMSAFWEAVKNVLASIEEAGQNIGNSTYVTAKDTDTPRTLADRFGDVVNVKDFGAKGDGVTDDTFAFKAAAAAGKSVFVPRGNYIVREFVNGDFYALPETVSISGSTTFARCESQYNFKKDIIFVGTATLPLYSFAKRRWGDGLKMSLQGIATDDDFNFYIVFSVDTKITNSDDNMFLVAKFSNSFEYIGCSAFESSKYVEQIQFVNGNLEFAGTSEEIYSYQITDTTWNESINRAAAATKKVVGNEFFDNDFQLYHFNGVYFNSCRSTFSGSQGGSVARDFIFAFDEKTMQQIGVSRFEYPDVGWNGDMIDATTPTRKAFPKRQSFCVTDESFIFAVGAYWSPTFEDDEHYRFQGIKLFDRNGGFKNSLLMYPAKLRTKLQSIGIDAQYVEQEGVTERYGQIFSIMAVGADDTFVVFRECSDSSTATDFSDCKAEEAAAYESRGSFHNLHLFNLLPQNPYTGESFGSLYDVLVFMRDTRIYGVSFTIYKGSSFDIGGLGFTGTTVSINIINRYGNAYLISYLTSDFRGSGNVYAILNESSAAFTPVSNRTANLILTKDPDFLGTSGRIYFDTGNDRLLLKMVIHDGSQDVIEYGGNSSVMNAATSHGFFASSNGQSGEKSGIGIVKIDYRGIFPYETDTFSLGIPSRLWSQVYAASGTIDTSDENEKQSIETYPDEVLDAWGDVQFIRFVFNNAVAKKGKEARLHSGIIAQQVVRAFADRGLDATRYGLLCFDRWQDEYEVVEVIDAPAKFDADGNEITPAKTHTEKRLVTEAGERYGIRYSEALCMEAAYQRRRADRLEARIAALEAKLK